MLALQYDVVVVPFVVVVIVCIRASGGTVPVMQSERKELMRDFPPNASYDYRVKLKLIKTNPQKIKDYLAMIGQQNSSQRVIISPNTLQPVHDDGM